MDVSDSQNNLQPDRDENDLNECSRLCAKYFYMNNEEIRMIKNVHKKLICGNESFEKELSELLDTRCYKLYETFFRRKNVGMTDWNTFFCFVIIMCFSPTPALFYVIIHISSESGHEISLEDILNFLALIHNRSRSENNITNLFSLYDTNNDGFISFMQFYSLVTKTWTYWENLFRIRKKLVKLVFTDKRAYDAIFYRKKYIDEIHEYQLLHKGKYRPLPCIKRIKYAIKSLPHPDKYDYNCFETEVMYSSIIFFCIKRYKPNFNAQAETFPTRLLRIYCPYEEFNTIDQFFLCYRAKMYNNNGNNNKREFSSPSSIKLSCSNLNLVDINNQKIETNSPKVPILKTHGRYSQAGMEMTLSHNESHFTFSNQGGNSGENNSKQKGRLRSKTCSILDERLISSDKSRKVSDGPLNKSFTFLFDTTPTKQPTEE